MDKIVLYYCLSQIIQGENIHLTNMDKSLEDPLTIVLRAKKSPTMTKI